MMAKFLIFSAVLFGAACSHSNSPEGVSGEFLFRYFIELNQRGALELSSGLAQNKLREEIELTQSVRMLPNLDLASSKPFLDYDLVNTQKRSETAVTLVYEITIENSLGGETKREVVITTMKLDGAWRVSNYDTFVKKS